MASIQPLCLGDRVTSRADPSDGKLNYPMHKARLKEEIDLVRYAEANLDALWNAALYQMGEHGCIYPEMDTLMASKKPERTSEWVEPTHKAGTRTHSVHRKLTDMHLDLQLQAEATIVVGSTTLRKPKAKTCDSTVFEEEEIGEAEPAEDPVEELGTSSMIHRVAKRALKVLKTIFFTVAADNQPGEIAWRDLTFAMISTGFSAEKLYGSVWLFEPTGLEGGRPIQFHEPHLGGKIPFMTARRHGRRFHRAYGWHAGSFVLA